MLAKDLWDQFRSWAKRNNFKVKITAADFAKSMTEFSSTENSGVRKYRDGPNLVFDMNPANMKTTLASQGLLDEDVW